MTIRRRVVLGALPAAPLAAAASPQPAALVAALRGGGQVVFMRHAITNHAEVDTGRLGDRAGQRNLSAAGRAQAAAVGRAFAALGIPVGAVLASAVFRAADTAMLAFGRERTRIEPFMTADDYTHDATTLAANIATARRRLTQPPAMGNDVLVGHRTPLMMILGRHLTQAEFPEGALAVFRPGGAEPDMRGILRAEALIEAAA
jgi:phosphohistidine phosphatase SixA